MSLPRSRRLLGHNGRMSQPELAPRNPLIGMVVVWVVGAIAALLAGFLPPAEDRFGWMLVAAGAVMLFAFLVPLSEGRSDGFIGRMAGSVLGALAVMALISIVVGAVSISQILAGA